MITTKAKVQYSSIDLEKLVEFSKKVSSEIIDWYGTDFEEEYSSQEMFDYIKDWGETNNMTADEVISEFIWQELTGELGFTFAVQEILISSRVKK